MKKSYLSFLVFIVVMVSVFSGNGIAAMSARSIGLGDEFVTLEGLTGLYSNPATLDLNDNPFALELNLAGEFWNNIFTNDIITESDKERLLDIAESNGMLLSANGKLGIKMAIGPVTFFSDGRADSLFQLTDDFAELLLMGNELEGSYSLDGTNGAASFYADSGINYSFEIDEEYLGFLRSDSITDDSIFLGFTYHYLKGGFVKYQADGGFDTGYDESGEYFIKGNDGKAVLHYTDVEDLSSLASGHAFDLGVYGDYGDRYSWGVSILNIGASLKAESYREYEYTYDYDEENDEMDISEPADDGLLRNEEIEMKLPLIIKVGGKMEYMEDLNLLANYTITNYSDSIYTESLTDHRFALAAEYDRLHFLPLRAGVNYSTLERDFDIATGLGLYLGPFRLDVGISDLTGLFYKSKGVEGGLNFGLVF